MDPLSIFIAIISVLIGIIVAIIIYKKQKTKTEITFLSGRSISLFASNIKDIDGVRILYNGEDVDGNLILYKGIICNSGSIDIDNNMVHEPYTLILPDGFEWKKITILNDNKCNFQYQINGSNLIITWDLIQRGEYLLFDSTIEKKIDSKEIFWEDRVDVQCRITNVRPKKNEIPAFMGVLGITLLGIFCTLMIIITGYYSFGQLFFPKYNVFMEYTDGVSKINARPEIQNKWGFIPTKEILYKTPDNKVISNEYIAGLSPLRTISLCEVKLSYWRLFGSGIFFIIVLLTAPILFLSLIRERNLYNKIKNAINEYHNISEKMWDRNYKSHIRRTDHLLPN